MRIRLCAAALMCGAIGMFIIGAAPAAAPVASKGQNTSTLDDQIDLALTV